MNYSKSIEKYLEKKFKNIIFIVRKSLKEKDLYEIFMIITVNDNVYAYIDQYKLDKKTSFSDNMELICYNIVYDNIDKVFKKEAI